MPPSLLLYSGLIDLTFASPLPSYSCYDDEYDTDEKDDDAEGRERDYYPFLLLALIMIFITRLGRLLLIVFYDVFDIFVL